MSPGQERREVMSEQQASYELPPTERQHPPDLLPCTCTLGAHVLEILEGETAVIVKIEQINETVCLEKEELYRLLQVLQELFEHGRV